MSDGSRKGDPRGALVRFLEGVRSGEIAGGPL